MYVKKNTNNEELAQYINSQFGEESYAYNPDDISNEFVKINSFHLFKYGKIVQFHIQLNIIQTWDAWAGKDICILDEKYRPIDDIAIRIESDTFTGALRIGSSGLVQIQAFTPAVANFIFVNTCYISQN